MTLREHPVERSLTLPDGRSATIRVALAHDDYIADRENVTVGVELRAGEEVLAVLDTVLDPEDTGAAKRLVDEAARRLEAGELEPTAHALEPLADRPA